MAKICVDWHNEPQDVTINGKFYHFKSKQEHKWAQYLEILRKVGAIESWEYEPVKFEFRERWRKRRQYTPDFLVRENDNGIIVSCLHEVKVNLTQKDVLRFKLLKADFPNEIIVLVLNSGERTRDIKQIRLKENARKYVSRIVYAQPIFKKYGIIK